MVVSVVRSLSARQEPTYFRDEASQAGFDDVPHQTVVHVSVAMNQNVAEAMICW